jgi:hypothetical protein
MTAASILCVGKEPAPLTARCGVLATEGYFADWATPDDFLRKLSVGRFNIVILSAVLSRSEKSRIHEMIPATVKTIDLDRLILPPELLHLVAETLNL